MNKKRRNKFLILIFNFFISFPFFCQKTPPSQPPFSLTLKHTHSPSLSLIHTLTHSLSLSLSLFISPFAFFPLFYVTRNVKGRTNLEWFYHEKKEESNKDEQQEDKHDTILYE
jgi:hypothetical protein